MGALDGLSEEILTMHVCLLCNAYGDSAENLGTGMFLRKSDMQAYEKQRYENGLREVLEIAVKFKDKVYRDAAFHAIFNYCMKARDFDVAAVIVKAITDQAVQEKIISEHGQYFMLNESNRRIFPTVLASLR